MEPQPRPREVSFPLTKLIVNIHVLEKDVEVDHYVYEGDVEMSQQQADQYKNLVGDGMAKVSISKELSEKNFGNGGSAMVTITLTCDQSYAALTAAVPLASQLAEYYVGQHFDQMRSMVGQKGIRG